MNSDMDYVVEDWIDGVGKIKNQTQYQTPSVVVFCDDESEKALRLAYESTFPSVGFLHAQSDLDDMLDSFEHVMNTQAFIVCAFARDDERRKVFEKLMDLTVLKTPLYRNSGYISFGIEKQIPVLIIESEPDVAYLASIVIGMPLISIFLGMPLFSIDEGIVSNSSIETEDKRVFMSARLSADGKNVTIAKAIEIPSQAIAVFPEFSHAQSGDVIGVINLMKDKKNEKYSAT